MDDQAEMLKVLVLAQSHPSTLEFTAVAERSKAFGTMFTKRVRPWDTWQACSPLICSA